MICFGRAGLLTLLVVGVTSSAARADDIKATSRIDAVTVFPRGAEVTRLARLQIRAGEHAIVLDDLPGLAIPNSIRVEGRATGRLEIGAVDSRRFQLQRTDIAQIAAETKRLETEIEKLGDDKAIIQAAIQAAEAQKSFIANLATLPTRPIGGAASVPQPDWSQLYGLIGERMEKAHHTIVDLSVKSREIDRTIEDLKKKQRALAPAPADRTEIRIAATAGSAIEADLIVRYQVDAASWTPLYDARLATGSRTQPAKLALARRASIQQRTGESWDNITLALSTTRPGAGTSAPDLRSITLDFVPDAPPPALAAAPATRQMMRERADEDQLTRQGAMAKNNLPVDQATATVDVGAFQAIYGIPGRVTVPQTGDPKRVLIDEQSIDPALSARTVPKRDPKAYLYAKMTLPKLLSVLPGQVSLFRDGVFVGNGRLPQLAGGEEHELGFGQDDRIRVRYDVTDETKGESGIISTSKTDAKAYRITVKSLHERPMAVSVIDQVPIAQNQEIKVELTTKTAPTRRDMEGKRGLLAWDMTLAPDEEKVVEFGHRIVWPAAKRIQQSPN
jgi:uncharacterized protein (TIGR02231 family)